MIFIIGDISDVNGKYQYKEKPLKHQRRLGLCRNNWANGVDQVRVYTACHEAKQLLDTPAGREIDLLTVQDKWGSKLSCPNT